VSQVYPLGAAVLLFVLSLAESCNHPAHADAWTAHEVALARLCVNEASTSARDCLAIVQARGGYDVETLRRMHPRALADVRPETDSRRWIAGLDASMERPEHWPESDVPWESRGVAAWRRVLETVRAGLRGQSACSERPHVWGGRALDADHIQRRINQGFRVVDCGPTKNVFLRRGWR